MFSVVKAEIKKNFKFGVIIVWMLTIFLAYSSTYNFDINETYANLFSKWFGLAPFMGLTMFMMFSGSFIIEYNSNMDGLIKATKNGKKQLVISKFIAAGVSASIVNLSILYTMVLRALVSLNFKGLDTPLKNLWYFGNSGSNITVIQMILMMTINIIIGSFLLAALGLFLSSISKNAIVPFLIGGACMAIPYFMEARGMVSNILEWPILGMYATPIIRYKLPLSIWAVFIGTSVVGVVLFYNLAKRSFLSER
ncbi:hypothetical protein [Romboutsia sp. 1001216sp1]|uniref:hypothetical protein n=1 Tax=Romboutsia sp. 1001216sp1 TaxID=2986997 RepID=UPI00232E27C8|nr:hypothetical protein [Romboutsia sp. 1001216sp1]MDB8805837.1 hypothetical protein [Romboutsia sp. 1001216sp1]MDB8808288.1 hypothetical protein [Romboutsia sp. 1001216sp1]MDB8811590.1 hypothetical protein [Romboutsia sp. 1001216sp1]MDB8817277.1 hypothetical protein [Romboutsia sp. 1001216sp1]MDB8819876.1 hypothetical protein [Romboutsia sp. 1001216sp1]